MAATTGLQQPVLCGPSSSSARAAMPPAMRTACAEAGQRQATAMAAAAVEGTSAA